LWTIYFFTWAAGQSASCKASLAALRLYGYFCDFFVLCYYWRINMMMMMTVTSYLTNSKQWY